MRPSPIILLTDFGIRDPYVAIMKGVIRTINPFSEMIDMTHQVAQGNIAEARFILENSYKHFPTKSVFLIVIDPGVGTSRKAIAIQTNDYYFIAPDNGVLGFISNPVKIIELNNETCYYQYRRSNTFHGRDIFAPIAARLAGGAPFSDMGTPLKSFHKGKNRPFTIHKNSLSVPMIHIDHFGNIIFAIKQNELFAFSEEDQFKIAFQGKDYQTIHSTYQELSDEGFLFNSYDYLEFAVKGGNAAKTLNMGVQSDFNLKIVKTSF